MDNSKYLDEYYKNEFDANKNMSYANAFAAILFTIAFILYATRVFPLHDNIYILVMIIFPIDILILASPLFFLKTENLKKPGFKYYLLFSFLIVVGVLNILVPKHGIIAWVLPIVMANHFYNPKLGRTIFILCVVGLLLCLYAGMMLGEYDNNLLGSGYIENGVLIQPDSPAGRWDMLIMKIGQGENRFLKVFVYYFIPRTVLLTLVFFVSNALNKRTYNLLINEIRVNSDQQKFSTELEVAKDIQLATLPSEINTTKDIRIIAELKAAKEVGGDFYDYFDIDEKHVGIVIGDVSGKGVPAAMFMMKTITCFKNFVSSSLTPSQVLSKVNEAIFENNDSKMFVTCFFAILDKTTGILQFSNAGHNPPIIGNNTHFHYLKCSTGFILGCMKQCFCIDESIKMEIGDSITLYTDGITEARNSEGALYGESRLISFFNSSKFNSLMTLHHDLKDDIANFVKDAEQSDDMTVLTLMYHGDNCDILEKEFDAKMENMQEMLDVVKSFCEKQKIDNEFTNKLVVVGDEIFSNIIKYGYDNNGGLIFFRLLYNYDKKEFSFTIIDKAQEFNQLEINNEPVKGNAKDQRIGGLGILIVKSIMTECAYDRINGKNILILRKMF